MKERITQSVVSWQPNEQRSFNCVKPYREVYGMKTEFTIRLSTAEVTGNLQSSFSRVVGAKSEEV